VVSGNNTPMRPLPFAASDFSWLIAEKSAVNDAGVILMMVVDFDGVVVVGVDDDFDELPQADAATIAPTVITITTARFPRWVLLEAPNSGFFTSVSCHIAVAVAASKPGRGGCWTRRVPKNRVRGASYPVRH
jgi:hypothetical protein